MNVPSKLTTYLDRAKVRYEIVPHRKVFTAYDLGQTLKTKLQEIAKTLLVKTDSAYHLVVLRASDRLDLKKLQKLLGARKMSIASEKDMERELKVRPGALTPFGGSHKLSVAVDRGLARVTQALFSSGSFEHAIRMNVKNFLGLEKPTTGAFAVSAGLKLQVKPSTKTVKKRR